MFQQLRFGLNPMSFLQVEKKKFQIHQYQVTIAKMSARRTSVVKNREQVCDIFWQCVRRNEDFFGPYYEITFDDYASAFSINQWKFRNEENEKFEWRCSSSNKRVTLTVSYVSHFKFDINADDVAQRNLSATVVKSLVSQRARYFPAEGDNDWTFINRWKSCSGSLYYIPRVSTDPKVYIDAGVRAWLGVYHSVKVLQDRNPALCFGLVNRLFYELDMGLVDFYCEVLNETGLYRQGHSSSRNIMRKMAMNQTQRIKMNSLLRGVRLKTSEALCADRTNCYSLKERRVTFVKVHDFCAQSYKMARCCNVHGSPTMAEVYYGLGRKLEFPYLPLCEVGKGMILPLEVLRLCDKPQRYSKMLSESMAVKFIKGVSREPHQHKQLVEHIFNTMEFDVADTVKFLNAFKIGIIPKMIQCDGTVLDSPVAIDKERNEVPMTPERAIKRKELNGELDSSTNVFRKQFFEDMIDKCRERGLCMASEPLRVYHNITIDGFEKCVKDATIRFSKLQREAGDRNMEKILLVIVINDRTYLGNKYANGLNSYGFIKSICDNNYGIANQVVDASTVIRATLTETKYDEQTIYYNIALKINAKLGGINQAVIFDDDSRSADAPRKDAVMYVGIDVTHPTTNEDDDISIACVVANIDLAATRYVSKISVQMRARETIERFDIQFRELMFNFREHTGVWPRHVVILRDGVCDSEMIRTASAELRFIRKSWEKLTDDCPDSKPTYTYITIQKRHLTRFYQPGDGQDGYKTYVNLPSGTVVDNVVVSPILFDFYMVSQIGVLGTARPSHYTVVFDEWGLSADKIYVCLCSLAFISFAMTYMIVVVHRNVFVSLSEEDLDMRKIEIEKRLSVDRRYPGMHFV
ncbi:unnamed protein product [Angiostrongylus costaricensis]|uniref:Piwi domain-containing protein n=1 Tax=Angiostrongylus costaricensis TaxID=334426 RepID=A0A158PG85_ANGCS|nr:unnamed protein product [Angiostrongylus costaricensis]